MLNLGKVHVISRRNHVNISIFTSLDTSNTVHATVPNLSCLFPGSHSFFVVNTAAVISGLRFDVVRLMAKTMTQPSCPNLIPPNQE